MTEDFWKSKLKAFLHDPPNKCFDIAGHEKTAAAGMMAAGFLEEEIKGDKTTEHIPGSPDYRKSCEDDKFCDRAASAADRFLFPNSRKMNACFTGGKDAPFLHPFCPGRFYTEQPVPGSAFAEEKFQSAIGVVDSALSWKDKFLLYWRRWPEESAKLDRRLAFLPADTRIPDHSIWHHLSLTSAMRACMKDGHAEFAFLLFQIGPVQDFIECARSTRDCWSGSYILSWLMSKALLAASMEIGPDNVIFPALRGQPFFDLAMKDVYSGIRLDSGKNLWTYVSSSICGKGSKLRIPNLPNRFLMLVPQNQAEKLAVLAENAICSEWRNIADYAWKKFTEISDMDLQLWKKRWDDQIDKFLHIHWQTMDWDAALKNEELTRIAVQVPEQERDLRYFSSSVGNPALSSIGNTWNPQYSRVAKAFAARHILRDFAQVDREKDSRLAGAPKDALSGVESVIGPEELWEKLKKGSGTSLFKSNEGPYGAITIVKRLFPEYLKTVSPELNFDSAIRSTKEIAGERKYFAILAMDGDEIGKRLSGKKAKRFKDSLAREAREYFDHLKGTDFDTFLRPMSPSAHAQFSECLSNFALHLVEPVIRSFDGQLIYAGGDDVLAMLPAGNALAAAYTLRCMFRGEKPELLNHIKGLDSQTAAFQATGIRVEHEGWVTIPSGKESLPLMVPGTESDVSCGIAIAHHSFPLQRAIHEARAAEKRAKTGYGRAAFAMSLLKRSGEIVQWGSKWKSSALELFYSYKEIRDQDEAVRFPYSFAQQLLPYDLDHEQKTLDADELRKIILADFREVCSRQWSDAPMELAARYLSELEKEYKLDGFGNFVKLFLAVAFIYRKSDNGNNDESEE